MPSALVVALAAGLVASLNLLLTYGVIRRLREHTIQLAAQASPAKAPEPGHAIGEFAVTAVDGTVVTREWAQRQGVVAFLSPGCAACEEALPGLAGYVRAADRALIVVEGEQEGAGRYVEAFAGSATVVTQDPAVPDPVRKAFGVYAFPIVLTVGAGTVEAVLEPAAYGGVR